LFYERIEIETYILRYDILGFRKLYEKIQELYQIFSK